MSGLVKEFTEQYWGIPVCIDDSKVCFDVVLHNGVASTTQESTGCRGVTRTVKESTGCRSLISIDFAENYFPFTTRSWEELGASAGNSDVRTLFYIRLLRGLLRESVVDIVKCDFSLSKLSVSCFIDGGGRPRSDTKPVTCSLPCDIVVFSPWSEHGVKSIDNYDKYASVESMMMTEIYNPLYVQFDDSNSTIRNLGGRVWEWITPLLSKSNLVGPMRHMSREYSTSYNCEYSTLYDSAEYGGADKAIGNKFLLSKGMSYPSVNMGKRVNGELTFRYDLLCFKDFFQLELGSRPKGHMSMFEWYDKHTSTIGLDIRRKYNKLTCAGFLEYIATNCTKGADLASRANRSALIYISEGGRLFPEYIRNGLVPPPCSTIALPEPLCKIRAGFYNHSRHGNIFNTLVELASNLLTAKVELASNLLTARAVKLIRGNCSELPALIVRECCVGTDSFNSSTFYAMSESCNNSSISDQYDYVIGTYAGVTSSGLCSSPNVTHIFNVTRLCSEYVAPVPSALRHLSFEQLRTVSDTVWNILSDNTTLPEQRTEGAIDNVTDAFNMTTRAVADLCTYLSSQCWTDPGIALLVFFFLTIAGTVVTLIYKTCSGLTSYISKKSRSLYIRRDAQQLHR